MMRLPTLVLLCLGISVSINYAQRSCGAVNVQERLEQADPSILQNRLDIENFTNYAIQNGLLDGERTAITIPVVVHVVYNTASQNISDLQIQSQIDALNKDYRKLNTDWSNTPAAYSSLVADCELNFCLANTDPNGASTTGITRTSTSLTSFTDDDKVKYTAQGGHDAWPSNKYLNLWVCNLGGSLLGYAQFPGGPVATDGVVINYTAFGTTGTAAAPFNKGRTTTHEVGHWLNLNHIWGDDGTACTGSDNVNDTPNQADENYGCPTFPQVSCSNSGDMHMNYMDYVDDACMNMFTIGQKARMQALFVTGGSRNSLVTSNGCSGTPITGYCAAAGSNTQYEWINRVQFNSINNISGANGGYGNYTGLTTTVNKGSAYTITLTPGFAGSAYTEYFRVYIDYNGDLDFVDAGELAYTSAGTTVAVSAGITIPTTAITGNTRMRIIMKDGTISGPCSGFTYGEVEDYTLNIQPAGATCNLPSGLTAGSITSSSVNLAWTAVTGATSYTVQVKPSTSTTWTNYTATTNSLSLTGLTASTLYNWQVRTNCSSGSSSYAASTFTTAAATGCTDNYESNNTMASASIISVNTNITAKIGVSTDVDWFKFSNNSTQKNIKVTLTNLPADYDIILYNSSGTQINTSQNGGTTSETIIYNNAPVGTYYAKVYGYNSAYSSTNCYTLAANISSTSFKLNPYTSEESSNAETIANIYPNPTSNGFINLELENELEGEINVLIYDATGKRVFSTTYTKQNGILKEQLDLTHLSNGVYYMHIGSADFNAIEKLMITR